MFAVLAIAIMLASAVVPSASEDSDASSGSWKCTIEIDGNDIKTMYSKDGSELVPMKSVNGTAETLSERAGDWGFDEDGYGPFGSFYAAFDSSGKLVCHLDPNNLKHDLDGNDISSQGYNIMWCLPKHYVSVDGNTLIISSSRSDGEVAKSFVIEDVEYNYLAFGVYEATYNEATEKLGSKAGTSPVCNHTLAEYRTYANNNDVDQGIALLWNYHMVQTYRQCVIAVMGDTDSQKNIGYGNSKGSSATGTGLKDEKGPYFGTATTNQIGVRCFIDDVWGSREEYVDDAWWTSSGLDAGQNRKPANGAITTYRTSVELVKSNGWGTNPSTVLDSWGLPKTVQDTEVDATPDKFLGAEANWGLGYGGGWTKGDEAGISYMGYTLGSGSEYSGTRLVFLFQTDPTVYVQYDHSDLKALLEKYGYDPNLVGTLPDGITVDGHDGYEQLDDIPDDTGFRHVGWIVGDKEYPATHQFVKKLSHTAKSVWVGLPAVTYDHSRLVGATGDPYSVAGLSNGLQIDGNGRYEQLPDRDGYTHVGWLIGDTRVGPTDPFVKLQSHRAVSLWIEVPTVVLSHSNLTDIVGLGADGVSKLPTSMTIEGNPNYPKLPDTAGYRHIGWDVNGEVLGATAPLVQGTTHIAKSLWEKISDSARPIPIIPDEEEPIEVIVEKESEPWLGKDAKNVLLIAIMVAIIAELAVLSVSRRR